MRRFIDYIVLPKAISDFEASYLRRINRIGLLFFALLGHWKWGPAPVVPRSPS